MTESTAIPAQAWSRPLGEGYEPAPRPRVNQPMIDDGPWGGAPLGGIGAGSIGRTPRGDFARWHLDVGQHRFETIAPSQFSLFVDDGSTRRAHVLSTIRPPELPTWGFDVPVGAGSYHALYPNAWYVVDWDALPVRVVQRQFSPVLPHNYRESSYPVAIFETTVENRLDAPVTVGLMLSWQNVLGRGGQLDGGGGQHHEAVQRDGHAGLVMGAPSSAAGTAWDGQFAIAVPAETGIGITTAPCFGVDDGAADLWADFAADGRLDGSSTGLTVGNAGGHVAGAVAATFHIAAGGSRTIPFALAWDIPQAEFGVGTRWNRRYTSAFGTSGRRAWDIAATGLRDRGAWSRAIAAWQAPILADPGRPDWYKGALFNELYFMVDGGTLWTDGPPMPADGWVAPPGADPAAGGPFGRFAQIECFDYPFYNTLDVDFYASFARLQLWPELERAVIREFVASVDTDDPAIVEIQWSGKPAPRKSPAALPHDVGGPFDDPFLRVNAYRYQDINIWKDLNCKYVLQLWRDARALGDDELLTAAWPGVVRALEHIASFDRDGDGLPEHDGDPDQTYDTWPMSGPSAYGGALWLAALKAAIAMGERIGEASLEGYREQLEKATATFEARLWAGTYYRYDDGGGPSSESIMADQLAGQWYADATGLGDVVAPDRVATALRTVFERNVAGFRDGEMGAVNGTRPDGSVDASSEQSPEVWVGTTYALAAFMLGRGMEREAWQTARGAWNVTWNRGLWFRTPEAYDGAGNYRASLYLRPLAIWAIEHALATRGR
ncbi:MAG TPA: non-lysosomal glucosylceramidase [Candidatus Limnocylindrales bacterium]|nr:non-lysosomal glucosylceramidase [Candidatus Limnocylindrales bacterium]